MRAQSVAARAALAVGVIVLGTSCRPDRLTSPGADATDAITAAQLGAAWGSTQIDVRPDLDTLPLGSSHQLTIDIGSSRDVKSTARWATLDSSVATVNSAGIVTAVNGGTAQVVGKVGPAADTTTIVVAVAVAGVSVSPKSGSLTVGQQAQLSATTTDALGRTVDGGTIAWSSTNPTVATVSAGGVVTGVTTGDAQLVASVAGKSDTATVHVSGVPVTSVSIAPTTLALTTGANGQLTATASSNGTVLTDRLTTWTSSDESIARVSATGQVTAVGTGTATITATIDGQKATAAVTSTAAPVASVAVTANSVALLVGQTTQATATPKDANGVALTGRTVTWSTSNSSVATVSSSGVVTAVTVGSVTITATSEGVKGTVAITVSQATVASVTVNLNATSITVGQTSQATASAFDAGGQAIVGRAVTWAISPASVATISSSGVVTGVASGSATVTATVDGKSGSATISVAAPVVSVPPSSGSAGATPELPRAVVATAVSATPSPGATVRVPSGGDLQGAIDRALPGDVILLAAGGSYTGNFVLRAKSTATNSAWITIRTETTLPAEGTRVTPTSAASFAKIRTPNADPALRTDPAAAYYRISGVEIAPAAGATLTYSLVSLGDAGTAQKTLASVPHHLVFDRTYIHATPTYNLRRCVAANSAWTAVVDSWLADCHSNDGDSQAIWGSNGPGPFTIVNNRLEGAGENVMFGGSDSRASELMPSDITIRRNHIIKPATWQNVWTVKNLFELKVGRRVLFEANELEGSWVSGQIGFAILLKSSDQEGTAPWSQTADVTIRYNHIRRSAAGIQVSGTVVGDNVTNSTIRVLVEHNLIDPVGDPALGGTGWLFGMGAATAPRDVVWRHNTGFGTNATLLFYEGQTSGFVFVDNLGNGHPLYQWSFNSSVGQGSGTNALNYHAPGWVAAGNVLVGGAAAPQAPNNYYPARMADVGFTNAGGTIGTSFTPGNYRLLSTSPYKGKATDGTDPGVDHDRLASALAGVIVNP